MLKRFTNLRERGDTIIEVMIVLAVLGLALGIAYATANRSLLNARQAQENSQATALVQSQVEALRALSKDTTQNIYQVGPYCISQSTPYTIVTGSSCQMGSVPYTLAITYTNPTFTVTATWDDVQGQGKDTVSLSYRVYK
jgi:prepilin-type N-terminal cleavage/methylation domain-containing protein